MNKQVMDSRTQAALYALKHGIASLEGVEL